MIIDLIRLTADHQRHDEILGSLRADAQLMAQIWADAEGDLADRPGIRWYVALVEGRPAAWVGCYETVDGGQPVLQLVDHYEQRGLGRDLGLHALVYRWLHQYELIGARLPQVTYVFKDPQRLLEEHGWRETDNGAGQLPGHHWFRMERQAKETLCPRPHPATISV